MKFKFGAISIVAAAALLFAAAAASMNKAPVGTFEGGGEALVRENITKATDGKFVVEKVTMTDAGVYEVVSKDSEIVYADKTGRYIFPGGMLKVPEMRNITQERIDELTALESLDKLPLNAAVKVVRGNGSRRVAYFADANCHFCKKFEQELAASKVTDYTMYVFLIPALGQDSANKERDIWCSSDKAAAWIDWMVKGVEAKPASSSCKAKELEVSRATAAKLNVRGTPTIYFEDGHRVASYVPQDVFESRMQAASTKGRGK